MCYLQNPITFEKLCLDQWSLQRWQCRPRYDCMAMSGGDNHIKQNLIVIYHFHKFCCKTIEYIVHNERLFESMY